jgi:rare lipoprotein A (peptidoglycan hydrolase)
MTFVKALVFTTMIAHYQAEDAIDMPEVESPPVQQVGIASWYGRGNWHGDTTASGERFDPRAWTCAHRDLPFNTVVLVENRANGRRAWCRINDRGPYAIRHRDGSWRIGIRMKGQGRWQGVIDLSPAIARRLDMKQVGLQRVALRYWTPETVSSYNLAVLDP